MNIIKQIDLSFSQFITWNAEAPTYLILSKSGHEMLRNEMAEVNLFIKKDIDSIMSYKNMDIIITKRNDIVYELF